MEDIVSLCILYARGQLSSLACLMWPKATASALVPKLPGIATFKHKVVIRAASVYHLPALHGAPRSARACRGDPGGPALYPLSVWPARGLPNKADAPSQRRAGRSRAGEL